MMGCYFAAGPASAEPEPYQVPELCKPDAEGRTNHQACFDASDPNSPSWLLAAINLGSEAFWKGDIETAAHFYDLCDASGKQTFSDIGLHANRAAVYRKIGRLDDSLRDARYAWQLAQENKFDMFGNPLSERARFYALMYIVETFHDANAPEFEPVVRAFLATPARDEMDLENQAGILTEIGRYDDALKVSTELLASFPDHANMQNNHCYLLTLMGRAADGLPFCENAVAKEPDIAPYRHSYATALAALGRCEDAEAALAVARQLEPSVVIYREPLVCAAP